MIISQAGLGVRLLGVCLSLVVSNGTWTQLNAQTIDFRRDVAPVLVSHCLECHRGGNPKGGLNLTQANLARRGGESGEAIVSGNAEESLLWERVSRDEMPPRHRLSDAEKETLKRWIDEGATWGDETLDLFSNSTKTRAGRDWWSLQPLHAMSPPALGSDWGRNEVDAFVLQKIQEAGLRSSPEADPRRLIRRLYFDLIGLPPTPEEVAAFVADPSDSAYGKIVDKLLDSHHHGERWGRHWLDVVRFGESDGFERNVERENAWHYRDWVIRAFNNDMPYNEFVRMQLIGDQLDGGVEGASATGFWVAGVHNTVVGGSKRMKQLARQDEVEEVLGTVGQTFVGLTFNCARCHDHKFDPITQAEYYQLASTISGLGYGERVVTIPEEQMKLAEIGQQLANRHDELVALENLARGRAIAGRKKVPVDEPERLVAMARWEFDNDLSDSVGTMHGRAQGTAHVDNGALILDGESFVETAPLSLDITAKTLEAWVQLENLDQRGGAVMTVGALDGGVFDAIVFGEIEPRRWIPGSNGFVRTESFSGGEEAEADSRLVHMAIVYQLDGTIIGYRDGVPYGQGIRKSELEPFESGSAQVLFGLRHKPAGGNRFLKARIARAALYDRALSAEEVAASAGGMPGFVSEEQLAGSLDQEERELRAALKARIAELVKARDEQAKGATVKVYSLSNGAGETTNVLLRGDPENLGPVVSPGTTAAVAGMSADFGLPPDAPEGVRRRKFSEWVTDRANPLFARVIVNRVWHYHFGAGLVETPNDFGFNGGRPTHPELLDYLAVQFQQNGYRLKWLHRQIVSSSAYRQSTHGLTRAEWQRANGQDASNRLLWRGQSRRLEAESVRDAMLSVAGELNDAGGGPSFKDVSVTFNSGTTYYEPIDVKGPEFFRRTVYRFNPRGDRSALLDSFDCPDPASTAPRRSTTTTPLQALSLMNSSFVLRMADSFADRVRRDAGDEVAMQVSRAWQLAVGREPDEQERQWSEQLVLDHGLRALCRGLFNFNEFVVIE